MQAATADVIHRRLPAFGNEPGMQTSTGEAGHACQIGDLQRVGGVLVNVRIQCSVGQAPSTDAIRSCVVQTGQQQHRTLLRNQRILDRAVGQPGDQLALPGIQRQPSSVVEQASAGFGMIAQGLRDPLITGHVQYQATAAIGATARMVRAGWHHGETLLNHLAATPVDLEIQRARQPEHQLCVLMAVDDQVVAVLTKGEDRSHRGAPGTGRQFTPRRLVRVVTRLTCRCHGLLIHPAQAGENQS